MKNLTILKISLILAWALIACDDSFLDKKPNKSIVIPTTLDDLQALLDNAAVMNISPGLHQLGTDDLFTNDAGFAFLTNATERNSYTWAKDFYEGINSVGDWRIPYQQVFYANIVLETLPAINITASNQNRWKEIKGSALFLRAHAFYSIAQVFAPPFQTGPTALGIPLRTTADVNAPVVRASIKVTYDKILNDLLEAEQLLPLTSAYKTRPTKVAARALLARTSLTIEDYPNAELYASTALEETSFLLDYNTINPSVARPIPRMNDEILFYSSMVTYRYTASTQLFVDTTLFSTYHLNDIRRAAFFQLRATNRYTFKGSYTGTAALFSGISNGEVYLIRAESRVRNGNIQGALDDLNILLTKRWKTGTFSPIAQSDPQSLLDIILLERQKELVFRGTRWTDLRRLNFDPNRAITLHRKVNGNNYSIPPKDLRYTFPIPPDEINTSGIQQNPR